MQRYLTWATAIALSVVMVSFSYAQSPLVIEIDFRGGVGETGRSLDDATLAGILVNPDTGEISGLPFSVPVEEDERAGAEQLLLTVNSFTGTNGPTINTSPSAALGLGINSGGFDDGFVDFDADFNESLVISFSQNLFIQEVDLQGLSTIEEIEEFQFGDTLITDADTPSSDSFSFITGGTPNGMFLAAGETLLIEATVGSVSLQSITVQIEGATMPIDFLIGDVNMDAVINFFDIQPFIDVLANQEFQNEADTNQDGLVDFFDIQPFIDILASN